VLVDIAEISFGRAVAFSAVICIFFISVHI
jgi:hypothetical protein